MIIDTSIEQGTVEWIQARLGVVTASCMGNVVTGSTCKKSASQKKYAWQLAAEHISGEPLDAYKSLDMMQGHVLENEARAAYTLLTGRKVREVGLIYLNESKRTGGSPDGLIFEDGEPVGGCELKNVAPHTQVGYLYTGGVPTEHKAQVYSSLYISGLAWWDFFTNSPGFKPHLVRVTREDPGFVKYAAALDMELPAFMKLLDDVIAKVRE